MFIERYYSLVILVAATLPAFGCLALFNPTAERVVRVQGRIEGINADAQCMLTLVEAANHREAGQRSVNADFATAFVVAPGRQRPYYTKIECDAGTFRSRIYTLKDYSWVIDLATITLSGAK